MLKVLKGNIIFTKTSETFTVFENSYIILEKGKVKGIFKEIPKAVSYTHLTLPTTPYV